MVLGGGALTGYGAYHVFQALYVETDVPVVLKVATPIALVGCILLLAAVVRDRVRARREERFEGVRH